MKFLFKYLKGFLGRITGVMGIKLLGTALELMIPFVMEHLIDHVVPQNSFSHVLLWGGIMIALAVAVRFLNVTANRMSVLTAKEAAYNIRRDLFGAALRLSGSQMDRVGLPSLISRMTSDSYNVQSFIQSMQTMGIRAPIMLVGGIAVTLAMDAGLALILCIMAPVMIALVVFISMKGIPLYDRVQAGMDDIVRIMRENITGVRVVKALSREEHEKARFAAANGEQMRRDIRAGVTMAMPGPIVTLFLNVGLALVVFVGARRVNSGQTEPGVILAFLTYFNMILMGVMGLNRIFMMLSKANASAKRIAGVVDLKEELTPVPEELCPAPPDDGFIVFDDVSFSYDADAESRGGGVAGRTGEGREGGAGGGRGRGLSRLRPPKMPGAYKLFRSARRHAWHNRRDRLRQDQHNQSAHALLRPAGGPRIRGRARRAHLSARRASLSIRRRVPKRRHIRRQHTRKRILRARR